VVQILIYCEGRLPETYRYTRIKRSGFVIGNMVGKKYKKMFLTLGYRYSLRNIMWEYYLDERMSNSVLSLSAWYFLKFITGYKKQKTLGDSVIWVFKNTVDHKICFNNLLFRKLHLLLSTKKDLKMNIVNTNWWWWHNEIHKIL
jgi:hypothetical protein